MELIHRMTIEYKISWSGSEGLKSVTVETASDLAKHISELKQKQNKGYVKQVHVYQREVSVWAEVTFDKEIFKPGDRVQYQGVFHTLMVLVFPEGVATWVAIAEEIGSEATLIEETDLLEQKL